MNKKSLYRSVLMLIALGTPVTVAAAGEDGDSNTGVAWEESAVDLPGSPRLPADDSDAIVAKAEFSGFGTTFGCDGIGLQGMMASFESEIEMIADYYSENAGDLVLQALIYTEPSLYTMLNTTIADFKASMDQMLAGCNEAREWGDDLGSKVKSACLEAGGSAATCNDGEELAENAQETVNKRARKLAEFIDENLLQSDAVNAIEGADFGNSYRSNNSPANSNGSGGGNDGGAGGSDVDTSVNRGNCGSDETCGGPFNRLIVNGYITMRKETIDMLRVAVPSIAPASEEEVAENVETESEDADADGQTEDEKITELAQRTGKLHKWLWEKRKRLGERLDTMVQQAGVGESYEAGARAYRDEPYAVSPSGLLLRKFALLRERAVERSFGGIDPSQDQLPLVAFSGTTYGEILNRIVTKQARDGARASIAEFEAGVGHASINKATKGVMDSGTVKHYDKVIQTLRAELELADQYARASTEQKDFYHKLDDTIGAID